MEVFQSVSQSMSHFFVGVQTYGGFFCSKVKASLERPEDLLELVGFTRLDDPLDGHCLQLQEAPNTEVVLNVAFDCQVAAAECIYIGDYYEKMRIVGMTLKDAIKVVLAGGDELVHPTTGALPVKGGGGWIVGVGGGASSGYLRNGVAGGGRSVVGGGGTTHTFMAVGGMGMGVVVDCSNSGTSTTPTMTHQVIAATALPMASVHSAPPTSVPHGATSAPLPHMHATSQQAFDQMGLKVELPQHSVYAAGRPPSLSAGSRVSYGSSAYGSGTFACLRAEAYAHLFVCVTFCVVCVVLWCFVCLRAEAYAHVCV